MKIYKREKDCRLLSDNRDHPVIADSCAILKELGFSGQDIRYFSDRMTAVLNDFAAHFGEEVEIDYIIRKRLGRLETLVGIPGEAYDPFENGDDSQRRKVEHIFAADPDNQAITLNYAYLMGRNVISGIVPLSEKRKSILSDPVIIAVLLGILAGVICLHLPAKLNAFILNDLLDPVYSILLKVLAGVMGPVLFISLVTAIISLDNVNDLTDMGTKIFKRFLAIIIFVVLCAIAVSMLFFGNFGPGGVDFAPNQIITMLLNIIPVNVIRPFLDNNTPQIVVLALISGIALLILGKRTRDLSKMLHQCNDWMMGILRIVNKLLPAVPFLSICLAIGNGNGGVMLEGWKFIVASYIIYTFMVLFKIIKTGLVTKVSGIELLKRSKAPVLTALATASTSAPLAQIYESSTNELHIKPEFSSFFVPMCSAMLALKTSVNVVIATMMMTEMLGIPISLSFLFVLIILTTEMSLASPGTVGSWVIAFEAFSMPTSYVGLFSTYRVLTANYSTGAVIAYNMLEEFESAYKMGQVDMEALKASIAENKS